MGAVVVSRTARGMPEQALRIWFNEQLSDMAHESGTGPYSGNWCGNQGLHVHPNTVKTDAEAAALCERLCDKWGPVLAVRVGDFTKVFPQSKADKALSEKAQELTQAVDLFDWSVLDRAQKAKSKTRKCPHCESSINVKHMCKPTAKEYEQASRELVNIPLVFWQRGRRYVPLFRSLTDCPVCGKDFLMTDTDKKSLASLVRRRDEAAKKLQAAKAAYEAKAKGQKDQPHWYVSALCGS